MDQQDKNWTLREITAVLGTQPLLLFSRLIRLFFSRRGLLLGLLQFFAYYMSIIYSLTANKQHPDFTQVWMGYPLSIPRASSILASDSCYFLTTCTHNIYNK